MIRTIDLDTCDGGQKELHDAIDAGELTFFFRKGSTIQLVTVEMLPNKWRITYSDPKEEQDAEPHLHFKT